MDHTTRMNTPKRVRKKKKRKKNENRMRGICLGKVGWEESQKKRVTECKLNVWEGVNSSFKSKPT